MIRFATVISPLSRALCDDSDATLPSMLRFAGDFLRFCCTAGLRRLNAQHTVNISSYLGPSFTVTSSVNKTVDLRQLCHYDSADHVQILLLQIEKPQNRDLWETTYQKWTWFTAVLNRMQIINSSHWQVLPKTSDTRSRNRRQRPKFDTRFRRQFFAPMHDF